MISISKLLSLFLIITFTTPPYALGSEVSEELKKIEIAEELSPEYNKALEEGKKLIAFGDLYLKQTDYEKADSYYEKAYQIAIEYQILDLELSYYLKKANLHYTQHNYSLALVNYGKASDIAQDQENNEQLIFIYKNTAYSYYEMEKNNIAKDYLTNALVLATEANDLKDLAEISYNLAILSKKLGYLEEYEGYNDQYEAISKKSSVKLADKKSFHKLSEKIYDTKWRAHVQSDNSGYYPADIIILQGLNKITAKISQFEIPIGSSIQLGALEVRVRSCLISPPEYQRENKALIEVLENEGEEISDEKQIFYGWMFTSSPSLSSLEHPIYDLKIINCKNRSS